MKLSGLGPNEDNLKKKMFFLKYIDMYDSI